MSLKAAILAALCVSAPLSVHSASGFLWAYDPDNGGTCTANNKCGPARWGDVVESDTTNECNGEEQSPINIVGTTRDYSLSAVEAVVTGDGCSTWKQYTDSNSLVFHFANASCSNLKMNFNGKQYTLLQSHFHSPSENTIGGGYADAEIHFVHQAGDGTLAVIGVMLYAASGAIGGSGNVYFKNFWDVAAANTYDESDNTVLSASQIAAALNGDYTYDGGAITLNPYTTLLPTKKDYFHWQGSLTTYPCSEGVQWILMREPVYISKRDLSIIREAYALNEDTIIDSYGNNARPVQPLYARTVTFYAGYDTPSSEDDDDELHPGVIAAIVIGSLIIVGLAAGIVYTFVLGGTVAGLTGGAASGGAAAGSGEAMNVGLVPDGGAEASRTI